MNTDGHNAGKDTEKYGTVFNTVERRR